jgi:hypothetical protein
MPMTFDLDAFDHEHAFFYDEDPRFLICRCGQYARRTRTAHGQPMIVLIDPPAPILLAPQRTELRTALEDALEPCPLDSIDAREERARVDA